MPIPSDPTHPQTSAALGPANAILVVDDDGEILQLIARFLRANGFHVVTTRSGAEMQESLRSADFDLVVLDVMLPGPSPTGLRRRPAFDVPQQSVTLGTTGCNLAAVLSADSGSC